MLLQVKAYVNRTEKQAIEAAASAAGVSVSEWLRTVAYQAAIQAHTPIESAIEYKPTSQAQNMPTEATSAQETATTACDACGLHRNPDHMPGNICFDCVGDDVVNDWLTSMPDTPQAAYLRRRIESTTGGEMCGGRFPKHQMAASNACTPCNDGGAETPQAASEVAPTDDIPKASVPGRTARRRLGSPLL